MSKNILLSIFLSSFLFSETCLSEAQINEQYFNEDIIGLYLSAIDFTSGESSFLFFDLLIDNLVQNNETCIESCSNGSGLDCFTQFFNISFDISMFIDQYHDTPAKVADGNINIFDIPSNTTSLRFRNTDLNFDTQNIQGASFELSDAQIYIESQQDELTELFVETGRVPNGRYYFNFNLNVCNEYESGVYDYNVCSNIDSYNKQIDIFVPSYIDLLSPGSSALQDTLINQISNTYPTFQWNSDYCSNCDFSIRIAEYKPLVHSSLQEAINDYSIVPIESGFYDLNNNISVFQYPASGFDILVEGKFYVWQIKRSYETTNGTYDDFSPIFVFKISSPSEQEDIIRSPERQSEFTLDNIRLLIGESNYSQLFSNGGPLYGYDNVDSDLLLNNESLSINYLLHLIQLLNMNQLEVIEVNVE